MPGKDDASSEEELYVPLRVRREIEAQKAEKQRQARAAGGGYSAAGGRKRGREAIEALEESEGAKKPKSLLEMAMEAQKEAAARGETAQDLEEQRERERVEDEKKMLEKYLDSGKQLKSVFDAAHNISYDQRMRCTWQAPQYLRDLPKEEVDAIRDLKGITVEGADIAPPCLSFRDLKLPPALLRVLGQSGITKPTPIQQQGLPVVLSGRDLIGVSYTGSGKTLVFVLPMIVHAFQEELMMPLASREGPLSFALAPSRELAQQTYEIFQRWATALRDEGLPELRCYPAIGGMRMSDMGPEADRAKRAGMHSCIATPGRFKDSLEKNHFSLSLCTLVCLDEADRMVDMGFEDDIREIYQHFRHQRQTIMFSATMPKKIQQFALTSLVDPVMVNVNRAGAANMDVRQEVEYIPKEHRLLNLLECLQKTSPPVMIFAEQKHDVDFIHEYLLLKGIQAVSIHGSKDQAERTDSIKRFKDGQADVLCATDIASKGLDFPDIQHVINFDLPKEIENYVHRIGRTGRNGKVGLATTFINKQCAETALLDLKHLLMEAKQRVPPVLLTIYDPRDHMTEAERSSACAYCGGLGHDVTNCPKLMDRSRQRKGDTTAGDM
eukprot:TRINITY_DN5827_c0_g1_i2.p1 TRINITY_DN5827_c0_g1~~TRINITY_DN5827_c0_g1_i2.p1  ORF type:complete len:638 (+),score=253.08 TRINITY_DN5827_c0_g1_i2:89-1915(+)